MISAKYFDGLKAQIQEVKLSINNQHIVVSGDDVDKCYGVGNYKIAEVFAGAPCYISFSDDAHCEIGGEEEKKKFLSLLNYQTSWIEKIQNLWIGALISIVIMIAILFSMYQWGVPKAANYFAMQVPVDIEKRIGLEITVLMDEHFFKPSKLSDAQIKQAEEIFKKIKPENTRLQMHIELRYSDAFGANAVALPGGTIVVTDQLIQLILGKDHQDIDGDYANELAGILAHEMGHVEHRHSMQSLMRGSLVTVLVGSLMGDFSSFVALAPVTLLRSEFSREMETEADLFAIQLLKTKNISTMHLAIVMSKFKGMEKRINLPSWMRTASEYTSSHPPTDERIERFKKSSK